MNVFGFAVEFFSGFAANFHCIEFMLFFLAYLSCVLDSPRFH